MKVSLYHGTDRIFDTFKIDKELAKTDITSLVEGYGIYFSTSKDFAKHYGNVIYSVELDETEYTDFTKKETVLNLISTLSKQRNIPIEEYMNVDNVVEGIVGGDLPVLKLYKEIRDWLDSDYKFYEEYSHLITYEEDCLFEKIEQLFFENIKDVVKYYDSSFKTNIFICHRNPEKLKFEREIITE